MFVQEVIGSEPNMRTEKWAEASQNAQHRYEQDRTQLEYDWECYVAENVEGDDAHV